jgi:GNAT superfamily N-acetyltransferase
MEDYFFSSISKRQRRFSDDACAYLTGVEQGTLNLLIVKQQNQGSDFSLADGIRFLDAAGLPFSVVLRHELVPRFKDQLQASGLKSACTSTVMQWDAARDTGKSRIRDHHEIDYTDSRLDDWALPLQSAFAPRAAIMRQYRRRHQAAIDAGRHLRHFSLYVKGEPVSSLTLSMQNSIARLDDIGTRTEWQGRGYAGTLIRHALAHARSLHVSRCFLESSGEGVSVYGRAGFSALFDYAVFSREGSAE